ncbi:SAVED domain-containing protein [Myroides ceti]|uniref:SAVED domain-containing protein n=1 Tax=Paenimyroides ceti TaxID=395087 RepID=A0ABT8CQ93_9FLAO|nr:Hachiman antiphage defense system protein HamA [Paenimyroides ceti]MDN3706684.1 SAVED domain-containing protein [Paenimyroides ceti]MDN3709680.1 SAVED domain-containing protein [Paenimyroides ceti]
MKPSLIDLIKKTVLLEYNLPDDKLLISKSCVTHIDLFDDCYKAEDMGSLSRIIYESILYYAYDEFQLLDGDHQKMFINAFNAKFKYNYSADDLAKLKLGIYGESLLYAILKVYYGNETLVSRGYFYDIQKKSEVTGYDCFHLIQTEDEIQLWFGETKFYQDGKAAINKVFDNIQKAISDDYLINTNFTTILQSKGNIVDKESSLYKILDKWDKCIIDNLEQELIDNNIKLVYPILITFDYVNGNYQESIETAIKHINENYKDLEFKNISIDFSIFFILIPIESAKTCKETIIKWIDSKEPLTL